MELYKYLAKSEFATAIINIWYILMSGSNIKCWHVNAGNRFCLWKSVTISSLTSSTVALAKFIKSSVFSTGKKRSSSCRTRSTKTSGSRIWKFRNFLKKLELASQILFGLFVYYFDFNVFRTKISKNNGYITAIFWIYDSPTNKCWYDLGTD